MALDAEWGGTTAESYTTLEDAEVLIPKYILVTTQWDAATDEKKEALLRLATLAIDSFAYAGIRFSTRQTLKFPRWLPHWLQQYDDYQQTDVQLATVLQANYLLVNARTLDRHSRNRAVGIKQSSESVGPVREQFTYTTQSYVTVLDNDARNSLIKYMSSRGVFRG